MLKPNLPCKILIFTVLSVLILSSIQFPSEKTISCHVLMENGTIATDSTRANKPTNLTMAYNSTHLFFYIDVGNDASVWEDNMDSLVILIDGDTDGAINTFDTPRDQVEDFGMIAYAGWDFQPYETDRFGYIVKDSGNEDRDQDARFGNLMIDPILDNGSYNFTFMPGEKDVHRIYEVEINAAHFGMTLDQNTVLSIFVRVTFFNDEIGSPYTEGMLYGTSTFPDDVEWYTVDFQNPGGQELTVNDVTGQEPIINGTIMPGEWPASIMDITERDAIPRPGDTTVKYPHNGHNIMADGVSVGKIVVHVRDSDSNFSAYSVMGNLTQLNQSLPSEFKDDGTGGDEVAQDHNYTIEFTAPVGLPPNVYSVKIHVFDVYGNHFELMIKSEYINVIDVNTPPRINDSTPTLITLREDCNDTYLDLNDFFYDLEGDGIKFRVMDRNGSWGISYESGNLTASFIVNMSFRIRVKPNVYLPNGVNEGLTFKATDIMGSIENTLSFAIKSVNDPPELVYFLNSISSGEDEETLIIIKAKDSNDMEDTLSLSTDLSDVLPDLDVEIIPTKAAATNTYTYILKFTPTNEMVGEYAINVTIADNDKASFPPSPIILNESFSLNIRNMNDPPSFVSFITGGGKQGTEDGDAVKFDMAEDESMEIIISGDDDDFIHGKEDLTFTLSGHDPDRIKIERVNRSVATLYYVPVKDFNGDESIVVRVTDGDATRTKTVKFHVTSVNDDPVTQNWEIRRESEDEDPATVQIDSIGSRFYVRDKTWKKILEEWAVRDVDGDHVYFAWIIYRDGSPKEWLWDLKDYNGTEFDHKFLDLVNPGESGTYTVVLMIRDHNGIDFNGSFQTLFTNITVYKPGLKDDEKNQEDQQSEAPFLIIIICAAFVMLIIVGFVFVTSKAKYNMTEKEVKEKEEHERIKMEEALYRSQSQSSRADKSYFAPPTVEADFDEVGASFRQSTESEPAVGITGSAGDMLPGPAPMEIPFGGQSVLPTAAQAPGMPQSQPPPSLPPGTQPGQVPSMPPLEQVGGGQVPPSPQHMPPTLPPQFTPQQLPPQQFTPQQLPPSPPPTIASEGVPVQGPLPPQQQLPPTSPNPPPITSEGVSVQGPPTPQQQFPPTSPTLHQ